ncbi:hypothetical protein TCSYLVIO_005458 [Trypanosoma cruzi]|nr:hypothetical protein TCSYLVIO_005458 [Trypanosoma cruzi]
MMVISAYSTASICHAEALRLLVTAIFPSASIVFSIPKGSQMCAGGAVVEGALFEKLHQKLLRAEPSSDVAEGYCDLKRRPSEDLPVSPHGGCLQARNGPLSTPCSPDVADVWRTLYLKWPPQPVAGRPLWRYDSEESSLPGMPCWTPHAVAYIGGFEAPDLRQVVAPQLFAQVPPFSSDTEVDRTFGGRTFDYRRQKVPKFASRVLDREFLLREKGCAIHEPELLEMALPVTFPSNSSLKENSTETRRVRTFISFAGSEPNLRALQVAVDPMHRRGLRPAFGYSIAALKFALPPPLVNATRLLRQWNESWSPTPLSTAFWLSAVGHAVERRLPMDKTAAFTLHENACSLAEASKSIAFLTASLVSSSPQECWNNFFLPVERFEAERGVRELMDTINLLPVGQLQ